MDTTIGYAVALFAFIAILWSNVAAKKRTKDVWSRAALRLGGTYDGVLRFTVCGRPAEMRVEEGSEDPETVVNVDLRGRAPGFLKITTKGPFFLRWLFGESGIEVGDREFDRDFRVTSVPESLACRVFQPDRRDAVIRALREGSVGWMELKADRLRLHVSSSLVEELPIVGLARAATVMVDALLGSALSGRIQWMENTEEPSGECRVCGTELRERVVTCSRCRTPHHEECWRYAKQCSTYACKATRFVIGDS